MMFSLITLKDGTEIVHSHLLEDGRIKVYVETPVEDGFHNATIYIPEYQWTDVHGYFLTELSEFFQIIQANEWQIIQNTIESNAKGKSAMTDNKCGAEVFKYLSAEESKNKSRAFGTPCDERLRVMPRQKDGNTSGQHSQQPFAVLLESSPNRFSLDESLDDGETIDYPKIRNLDDIMVKLNRNGELVTVCFTDLADEEQILVMDALSELEVAALSQQLARRLRFFGDAFDIIQYEQGLYSGQLEYSNRRKRKQTSHSSEGNRT